MILGSQFDGTLGCSRIFCLGPLMSPLRRTFVFSTERPLLKGLWPRGKGFIPPSLSLSFSISLSSSLSILFLVSLYLSSIQAPLGLSHSLRPFREFSFPREREKRQKGKNWCIMRRWDKDWEEGKGSEFTDKYSVYLHIYKRLERPISRDKSTMLF